MPIDPYSKCPGGSGKKIKFCCSDLVSELGKLSGLMDSEQYAACVEHINRIEPKHPGRACLATLKSQALMELGETEDAEKTIAAYAAKNPNNPMALAELAVLRLDDENPTKSVELLQRAISACEGELPPSIAHAFLEVGIALANSGRIGAASQHLSVGIRLCSQHNHSDEQSVLRQAEYLRYVFSMDPRVPRLLKNPMRFDPAPEDKPWKAEHDRAIEKIKALRWLAAADQLAVLAHRYPQDPELLFVLAKARIQLGDDVRAAEALAKCVALWGYCPQAVDAECIRLALYSPTGEDQWLETILEAEIKDLEQTKEVLLSSGRAIFRDASPKDWSEEDGPPPLHKVLLYDRSMPENAAELPASELPRLVGELDLFGKETDRPARIEGGGSLWFSGEAYVNFVKELLGNQFLAEPKITQDRFGRSIWSTQYQGMVRAPAYQDGDAYLRLHELVLDVQVFAIRQLLDTRRWPSLNNLTLDEAAQQDGRKTQSAAILNILEDNHHKLALLFDWEAERLRLGLSKRRTVVIESPEVLAATLADNLHRIDCDSLPTYNLAVETAALATHFREMNIQALALRRAVAITELPFEELPSYVLGAWAQCQPRYDEQLRLLRLAIASGKREGVETGEFALLEIAAMLRLGQLADLAPAIKDFLKRYRENEVLMRSFLEIMQTYGLIREDGALMIPMAAQRESSLVLPGQDAEAPSSGSGIWTPDAPQASQTARKSILWTPGS